MIQGLRYPIPVDDFIEAYGDDARWELIDGELIDMEPTGSHEQVAAFIGRKFNVEIDRQDWPYFIPHRCLIQALGTSSAFRPDLVVLDQMAIAREPLWQREPVITLGRSVKVVVEVVSTNWQNDYARKAEEYELLGIPEFWIVDFLGLGGKRYIGSPKQPTLSIYHLSDGEYQVQQFRRGEQVHSPTFPELTLTATAIFQAGA